MAQVSLEYDNIYVSLGRLSNSYFFFLFLHPDIEDSNRIYPIRLMQGLNGILYRAFLLESRVSSTKSELRLKKHYMIFVDALFCYYYYFLPPLG